MKILSLMIACKQKKTMINAQTTCPETKFYQPNTFNSLNLKSSFTHFKQTSQSIIKLFNALKP